MGLQRVCASCSALLSQPRSAWSRVPFASEVLIASFLPPASVLALCAADRETHRRLTSRDFDQSFWRFLCTPSASSRTLRELLERSNALRPGGLGARSAEAEAASVQLSIRTVRTAAEDEEDKGVFSCTAGCRWRLEFAEKSAIPGSLRAALFFARYSVVALRIAALRQLRQRSVQQPGVIAQAVKRREVMASLIRCLQFGNAQLARNRAISREILELMLTTAGCLLNMTQSSREISTVFRESEGITTLISILRNEVVNAQYARLCPVSGRQTRPVSPEAKPSLPRLSESSAVAFTPRGAPDTVPSSNSSVRKLCLYLVGILMNLCNVDGANCREICDLNGVELFFGMIHLSNEKQILYCLECIKTCCRQCPECKVGDAGALGGRTAWGPATGSFASSTASRVPTRTW